MLLHYTYLILTFLLLFASACDSSPNTQKNLSKQQVAKGEYIYRRHDEFMFTPPQVTPQPLPIYEWKKRMSGKFPAITKHHFRCNGKGINPIKKIEQNGQTLHIADCNGPSEHSLPIVDGKEHIYPILIDLLNYIQLKSGKKVVVTSGHRCPTHHQYVDNSPIQKYSKHMIGAEVAFYVQGLEENPETAIALVQEYYQNNSVYHGLKDYQEFTRWEKNDSDTSTFPWYNKEIFIKLYKKNEGRNLDITHTHPYISIQVRFNKDKNEKVIYSWDKAFKCFYRH